MRVVQIPRRFVRSDWGGTETAILEMSKSLVSLGHQTEIFCPRPLAKEDREVMDGISVTRFDYFYPYLRLSDAARLQMDQKGGNLFSFPLLRALRDYPGLDVIHLHTGKRLGAMARHVAMKRKIPYVISLHGGVHDVPAAEAATFAAASRGAIEWGQPLGWYFGARRVLDDAAAILCVGQKEQEQTQRRYPNKRVVYLPNGVNAERFAKGDGKAFREEYGVQPDAFMILTVGRIDPQKNQILAVKALSAIDAHLVLIGHVTNAEYEARLTAEIAERGLGNRVHVIRGLDTHDPQLVNAFHAADLFLLPSVHEPFGIVILEAWAAGLPVVASNVGGIPSFVQDGVNGSLFPSNEVDALTGALKAAISDPAARQRLAEAGRKTATEYSWDSVTRRLVAVYEEVIRENPLRQ
jgi:glycosyltransferase involved in cell wall biosynthesis